jgi:hypothetical protein
MKLDDTALHNIAVRLCNEAQTDLFLKTHAAKETLGLSPLDATFINLQSLVYLRSVLDEVLKQAVTDVRSTYGPAAAARAARMVEHGLDGCAVTDVRIDKDGNVEVKDREGDFG